MPKVDGPSRIAYQVIVAGSRWTIGRPCLRKLSTSASRPGSASLRTSSPTSTASAISSLLPVDLMNVVRGPGGSAEPAGTDLLERDPDEHTPLLLHRPPVVVPVGVLAADAAVVVDQRLHRLWQRHDLGRALDLDPRPEEVAREDAQHRARVPAQIADLVGGLPAADGGHALGVHPDRDRRGLQPAAGAPGDRKSTRLNSSHVEISYAVFCLKKKKKSDTERRPEKRRSENSQE